MSAPVFDPHDVDRQPIVEDLVDDPVRRDTHPVGVVLIGQPSTAGRSGMVPEEIDIGADSLLFLRGQPREGLDRSAGDLHPVASHCRLRSALTSSQGA